MSQRAGWYDDPDDPLYLRYFDGVIWTANRQTKASPTAARSTIGYAGAPGAPGGPAVGGPPAGYGQPPPGYGQQPPPGWGQQPPPGWGQQGSPYGPAYGVGHAGLGGKTTPDGAPLAGWGTRFGAYVIDAVVVNLVAAVVGSYWLIDFFRWYVGYLNTLLDQTSPAIDQAVLQQNVVQRLLPYLVVSLVVQLVYQLVFLTRRGATPGKMLLKLQVRRRDRPGPPDVVSVLRRLALPVLVGVVSLPLQLVGGSAGSGGSAGLGAAGLVAGVSLLLSAAQFLDYLWPLWDDKNQALHDKIAATNVVVAPPKGR